MEELGKQEEAGRQIELKVGQHLIRTYELPTEVGRADPSSFSVHHEQSEAGADSLWRYGHSKEHRPDLLVPTVGTLDPAGIPLVSATLAGNGADDPLYYPTWQQMASVMGHKQFVFLADCKAATIATHAQIADQGGIFVVINRWEPTSQVFSDYRFKFTWMRRSGLSDGWHRVYGWRRA